MTCGCEVPDYVEVLGAPDLITRMTNEAANDEWRRRGHPEYVEPSGQRLGDAVWWVPTPPTCGSPWREAGTL